MEELAKQTNEVTQNATPSVEEAGKSGVETASTSQEDSKVVKPNNETTTPDKPNNQTFTQEQVNEFVRDRLERDRNSMFARYGVKNRDEFDALLKKATDYDGVKQQFDALSLENQSLKEKLAFVTNNVNPAKEVEIKALFKGLELPFNDGNLKQMLVTHPEWLAVAPNSNSPKTTITSLGVTHDDHKEPESDEALRKRLFGD